MIMKGFFSMNTKRTVAMILAAVMAAASLTACGNTKTPGGENTNDPSGTNKPSNEGGLSLEEISKQIEAKVGMENVDSEVVMTLDGYDITYSEYRYYYINYVKQFANYYGPDWNTNDEYKDDFDKYVSEAVKMNGLVANTAAAKGLALTQEEFDNNVSATYDTIMQQFGDDAKTTLDETYAITPYYMMMNESIYNLYNKIYESFYGVGGEKYEEIKKQTLEYYNDNGYMRAKHILIQFPSNDDGSEVTEEQKAETRKKAEEVLEKAKNGEDFDKLIEEYNEDPGMSTYTAGYYFGKGEMVEEFENATTALEENGISEIVESNYGYHIIKRLPLDDENIISSDKFSELAYADLDEFFTDKIASTDFVKKDNFDELVKPIIEEGEQYLSDLVTQQQAANSDTESETDAE